MRRHHPAPRSDVAISAETFKQLLDATFKSDFEKEDWEIAAEAIDEWTRRHNPDAIAGRPSDRAFPCKRQRTNHRSMARLSPARQLQIRPSRGIHTSHRLPPKRSPRSTRCMPKYRTGALGKSYVPVDKARTPKHHLPALFAVRTAALVGMTRHFFDKSCCPS